jgi:Aspartyl/Asparaginyl beta-hydroxylase
MTEEDIFKMKKIWRGSEIPVAEYLMSYQTTLREEFLSGSSSVKEACEKYATDALDLRLFGISVEESTQFQGIVSKDSSTGEFEFNLGGWKNVQFKYSRHDDLIDFDFVRSDNDRVAKKYHTAHNLVKEYGDNCSMASYSILAPQTILNRHTGPENRTGEYIRIHIPLIIPEGDLFLEASGEEVTWDNIWGFNNQHAHSAYNNSDEWRVIFMIDLNMASIGMTPCPPFDPAIDLSTKPFIRGKFSGII